MRAEDGWRLGYTVHAAERPVATVIALPAMFVDARSLDRPAGGGLASMLASEGLEVWRADFRGHGASGPLPAAGATWTYDDLVRLDVPALVHAARAAGRPVVLAGHSLGGHVSAAAVAEGVPADALVLLAANVWMPSLEPSRRRRARKAAAMAGFEAAALAVGKFPSRRLRLGPADEATGYVRDLARFWHRDAFASRDGTDWFAGMRRYRRPVLGVVGAGDALLAHPEAMRRFCDAFGPGGVDFHLEGRATGLPLDPDHAAIATDARCAPAWRRVAAWIRSAIG